MPSAFDPTTLKQAWPVPSAPRPIVIVGAGGIVSDAHMPAYRKAGFAVQSEARWQGGRELAWARTLESD